MKRWIEPTPVEIPPALSAALPGEAPLLLETLLRRGLADAQAARGFLDPAHYQPTPPEALPDMQPGVERVEQAIRAGQPICIWGDFDVDGQTATTLLFSALAALGAKVTYYIPSRHTEGHGLHIPRLQSLIDKGAALILTCDTGISAHEAIDYANSRQVDVLITDHHQLPAHLPAAYAAINPQRLPPGHPLRTLPGVGVAYKLVEALYTRAGRGAELDALLDLVALGIVADVAEQVADTRHLLQRGLQALRQTQRLGLQVLMQQAEINPANLTEDDIGFGIAPRLNASGRLDDANPVVEFLTTSDLERARVLATRLEALNAQRRLMTNQVYEGAQGQIARDPALLNDAVLLLSHESWPGGIVGLVASRLVEQYARPVILLTTPPGELARGSARSVPGCDISAAIAQHADLLAGYGGHSMAAGLSIAPERIPELRRRLSQTVAGMLDVVEIEATPTLRVDAYVPLADIGPELLAALQKLAPFGAGNPPLVLATRALTLKAQQWMGRSSEHARLTVEDEAGRSHDVIWWQADLAQLPKGRFDLAYTLHAHEYQGRYELRLQFVDARPLQEAPRSFKERSRITITDQRSAENPFEVVQALPVDKIIWAEGDNIPPGLNATRRDALHPAPLLVVWSAPPGPDELAAALAAVNPDQVMLLGMKPGTDSVQVFLRRLGGLVKHVLSALDGKSTLEALAGALAHRESTARTGLDWMTVHGHITYEEAEHGRVKITQVEGQPTGDRAQATARVAAALRETAAYRAYYLRADANNLIRL